MIPKTESETCPLKHMLKFLRLRRGINCKYLFCHTNGMPVTRYQFSAVLKKSLLALGYQNSNYRSHSFRIGAATTASKNGLTNEKVQLCGRWKSSAFKAYIRIPSANLLK